MNLFLDIQNKRNEKLDNISNKYFNNLHEQVKLYQLKLHEGEKRVNPP